MPPLTTGIHHVTAITRSPAAGLRFYTQTLGLRLVKRTVNFDDPHTHHLYFGDRLGSPGTVFTVFPMPNAHEPNALGPRFARTGFLVAQGSLDFWRERLTAHDAAFDEVGQQLHFDDPDGTHLSLEEAADAPDTPAPTHAGIPVQHRIRCFDGPLIDADDPDAAARFLIDQLGFTEGQAHDSNLRRFDIDDGGPMKRLCIRPAAEGHHRMGAGDVHHVAWRVPDAERQRQLRERLAAAGLNVSPILDRQYFSSIYVRIPGGVIFEFATDGPGFTADETEANLGATLKLPPQYEAQRDEIEATLPPLDA